MDCKHGIACRWTPIALGWAAVWITLGGLASLQALCWNTGVAGTNSRKLLEESDTLPVLGALIASCGKTYRFQWWGWALQVAYMAVTTGLAVKAVNVQGLHHVGTVSTVLAIIYANDTLKVIG